jgi:Ca2+-binding RTX toxin-like protein
MPTIFAKQAFALSPVLYDFFQPQPFDITATGSNDTIDLGGWEPPAGYYYRVHAGKGNDTVLGTNSHDEFHGDEGNDTLDGRGGNDQLYGGAGNDTIYGGAGMDTVHAGNDHDFVDGGEGNDSLFGGNGNDHVEGGIGNDFLYGDAGDDRLLGGEGSDRLHGGRGADELRGGLGADRFVIAEHEHHAEWVWAGLIPFNFRHPIHDTILDFNAAEGDKLDLSALVQSSAYPTHSISEALLREVIHFRQVGTPGSEGFGTLVMFDVNGTDRLNASAGPHTLYKDTFTVAFLSGVSPDQIPPDSFII